MVEKIVLSQKAQLEIEIRDAFAKQIVAIERAGKAKKTQYAVKAEYTKAKNAALAEMTKADGAEDQRKAKADVKCGMALAALWAADCEMMEAETELQKSQSLTQMYRTIVDLVRSEM